MASADGKRGAYYSLTYKNTADHWGAFTAMYTQFTDDNLDATISGLTVADVYKQSETCFAQQNPEFMAANASYTMPDCGVDSPRTNLVFYTGDSTVADPADIFRPPSKRTCAWSLPVLSANPWSEDGYTVGQDACKTWFNEWATDTDRLDFRLGANDYCYLVTGGGDVGWFSLYGSQLVSLASKSSL